MDVQHRVPLLVGVVDDARVPHVAGIVDEDVQVAEVPEACLERAVAELPVGHVAGKRLATAASAVDVGAERGQAIGVEVVGEDRGAFTSQLARDCAADALAGAGDERHATRELARTHCTVPFDVEPRIGPAVTALARLASTTVISSSRWSDLVQWRTDMPVLALCTYLRADERGRILERELDMPADQGFNDASIGRSARMWRHRRQAAMTRRMQQGGPGSP